MQVSFVLRCCECPRWYSRLIKNEYVSISDSVSVIQVSRGSCFTRSRLRNINVAYCVYSGRELSAYCTDLDRCPLSD